MSEDKIINTTLPAEAEVMLEKPAEAVSTEITFTPEQHKKIEEIKLREKATYEAQVKKEFEDREFKIKSELESTKVKLETLSQLEEKVRNLEAERTLGSAKVEVAPQQVTVTKSPGDLSDVTNKLKRK